MSTFTLACVEPVVVIICKWVGSTTVSIVSAARYQPAGSLPSFTPFAQMVQCGTLRNKPYQSYLFLPILFLILSGEKAYTLTHKLDSELFRFYIYIE